MNSNDLLAKLLANENLTIVRGNVITASFDLGQRVLVLPQWKDMPEVTEEMLILHEVGHALYTTDEYSESQKDKPEIFGHYLNVVEDARIERKMKQRYPGSRKSFIQGYKELNDRDFFKIKNHNLNDLSLIDRINLFYKSGMNCGVKFNETEQKFINEIDKAETIRQVIDIASRVYEYAKLTAQEEVEIESLDSINLAQQDFDENGDDLDDQLNRGNYINGENDEEDNEYDYEDDDEDRNYNQSSRAGQQMSEYEKEKRIQEKMRASTMEALNKNLESSADTNTIYKYYEPDFHTKFSKYEDIIGYKRALKEMRDAFVNRSSSLELIQKKAISFRDKNNSIVNNMVKEFEMRKSASAWKRAQVSKTGQLDPKKIYGYKIKDELFKQLTIVKNGKQHGMIFLLDWSGSMDPYLHNTIAQLINLVMFARRINVPFQVFAFSSTYNDYSRQRDYYHTVITNEKGLGKADSVTLIELFSNKMNERETLEMTGFLLNRIWYNSPEYSLSGTPLNEALVMMTKHIGKFIKNNNVEKTIFITLTDGEGNALYDSNNRRLESTNAYDYNGKIIKVKHYLKDDITGKQYEIDQFSDSQTRALLNLIKDRYNTINIGFNLINNNYGAINRFIKNVVGLDNANLYNIQIKMRSEKYYKIAYSGYSTYYLVDNRGLDVKNETDLNKVSSTMTANQVSKALSKVMSSNKSSRIILNNFVTEIA